MKKSRIRLLAAGRAGKSEGGEREGGRERRRGCAHHSLLHLMISLCPACKAKLRRTKAVLSRMSSSATIAAAVLSWLACYRKKHSHWQRGVTNSLKSFSGETPSKFLQNATVLSYRSCIVGHSSLTVWEWIAPFHFAGPTIGPVFGEAF
jgi:hypothetical protein